MKAKFESVAVFIESELETMNQAISAIYDSKDHIKRLIDRTPEAKKLLDKKVLEAYDIFRSVAPKNRDDVISVIHAFESIAEYLSSIYEGMEKVFLRIANLTGEISKDSNRNTEKQGGWHKDLLFLMGSDIKGVRSAVISRELSEFLQSEYLGFRHITHHNYPFVLNISLVSKKMLTSKSVVDRFTKEIHSFLDTTRAEIDKRELDCGAETKERR